MITEAGRAAGRTPRRQSRQAQSDRGPCSRFRRAVEHKSRPPVCATPPRPDSSPKGMGLGP